MDSLLILAFLLIPGYFAWSTIQQIWYGKQSESWPIAIGYVKSGEIKRKRSSKGGPSYRPIIVYEYEVAGQFYESNRQAFRVPIAKKGRRGREQAQAILDQFPKGEQVTVYYNPAKPEQGTLEKGFALFDFFWLTIFGSMFLIPIGFILANLYRSIVGFLTAFIS